MDTSQELKDAENTLRDFIAYILGERLGERWIESCGVTSERVDKWRERKAEEERRQRAGAIDERLIYYADFYDLWTILAKHWQHFAEALGERKDMEVLWHHLEKLRDPTSHGRELLPHQKSLAAGIAGEIRTRVTRYRSTRETGDSFFPRIEIVRDSLGNSVIGATLGDFVGTLRVGDVVDYVVTATDPVGDGLEYWVWVGGNNDDPEVWQGEPAVRLRIEERHVGRRRSVNVFVRRVGREETVSASLCYDIIPRR